MSVPAPPADDADVPRFLAELDVPGLVDAHVHFLPDNVMDKVWAYFDLAGRHYGMDWPIHYRTSADARVATLQELGVVAFAPLVYPHRPGMGRWLTEWVTAFAAATPGAVPTATLYPEPDVADYLGKAVAAGARVVKVHVQVGAFDPRDPLLRPAWGLLAEAGVPAVVHCGHGPIAGAHTGLDVFGEVLAEHPRLPVVLAHAGIWLPTTLAGSIAIATNPALFSGRRKNASDFDDTIADAAAPPSVVEHAVSPRQD